MFGTFVAFHDDPNPRADAFVNKFYAACQSVLTQYGKVVLGYLVGGVATPFCDCWKGTKKIDRRGGLVLVAAHGFSYNMKRAVKSTLQAG